MSSMMGRILLIMYIFKFRIYSLGLRVAIAHDGKSGQSLSLNP